MKNFLKKQIKIFIYVWEKRKVEETHYKKLCKELNLIHYTNSFKNLVGVIFIILDYTVNQVTTINTQDTA